MNSLKPVVLKVDFRNKMLKLFLYKTFQKRVDDSRSQTSNVLTFPKFAVMLWKKC